MNKTSEFTNKFRQTSSLFFDFGTILIVVVNPEQEIEEIDE